MMPQTVRFITVGNLKESYLREAAAEYARKQALKQQTAA